MQPPLPLLVFLNVDADADTDKPRRSAFSISLGKEDNSIAIFDGADFEDGQLMIIATNHPDADTVELMVFGCGCRHEIETDERGMAFIYGLDTKSGEAYITDLHDDVPKADMSVTVFLHAEPRSVGDKLVLAEIF